MSKTFVTSDCHFNSDNIIQYCARPFTDAADQTRQLISNWNSVVSEDDTVIVTGDFIMGDHTTIPSILSRLNGKIILVRGNHDTRIKLETYAQFPDKITIHDIYYLVYKRLFMVFCHFPITDPDFLKMVSQDNSEVVVCHGHLHDKVPFFNAEQHTFNFSVDVTDFTPVNLDEVYAHVKQDFIMRGVWGSKRPQLAEMED